MHTDVMNNEYEMSIVMRKTKIAEKDRIIADCRKYADSYKEAGIKNDESRAFIGIYNSFHISAMILANEDKIVEHCLNVAEN